jgi:hypothetical protein
MVRNMAASDRSEIVNDERVYGHLYLPVRAGSLLGKCRLVKSDYKRSSEATLS